MASRSWRPYISTTVSTLYQNSTTTPRQSSRLRRCGQSGAPVLGTNATASAMPNTITNSDEENLVMACTGTWPQSGNSS